MDFAALKAAVLVRGGWPSGDALYTDAVLGQLVNAALHHLETEHDWSWLEKVETVATAVGTRTVNVAADSQRTIDLHHEDGEVIVRAVMSDLERLRTASGPPKLFGALEPGKLTLAPTPAAVSNLIHHYVGEEPDLAAAADEPLLPARWHQAVVEYGAYLAFRREGNAAEAGAAKAAYDEKVEQMKRVASRYSSSEGGGEPTGATPITKEK